MLCDFCAIVITCHLTQTPAASAWGAWAPDLAKNHVASLTFLSSVSYGFILYLKWQESFWDGWGSDTQVQRPRAEACTLASSRKLSEPITGLPSVSSLGKISYSPGRPGSHYTAQIGLNSWSSSLYLPTAGITGVHYVPSLRLTFECLP